ncbi:MAG: YgiT-type zinc finger protein [Blastocatellia bacterium]
MTSENNAQVCVNCGKQAAYELRRDELFGSGAETVIVENIPMVKCLNCGIVYLEPDVSRRIDEICAHPELHTSVVEKHIAKIA